jgi:hypothetical protein
VVWKAVLLILLAVCDTSILVSHTGRAGGGYGSAGRSIGERRFPPE